MKRKANAIWKGTGKEGSGNLTTTSKVLNDTPYSVYTRFESEDGRAGTNPEELIAAAHAGCFNMALSFVLTGEGYPPESLSTEAKVTVKKVESGFKIDNIELHLTGKVSGISDEKFQECALKAKENCPVSVALSAVPIELYATLAG
jgi:osmotically inducible protein OsmC